MRARNYYLKIFLCLNPYTCPKSTYLFSKYGVQFKNKLERIYLYTNSISS